MPDFDLYRAAKIDQSDLLPQGQKSSGGACHCFSLAWASAVLKANPLLPGQAQARMNNLTKDARAISVMYGQLSDRWILEGPGGADTGSAIQGIEVTKVEKLGPSVNTVGAYMKKTPSTTVYSFWFPDHSGHSCAISYDGGSHLYFFDPNYGEFYVRAMEFDVWLTKLVGNYGAVTDNQLRPCINRSAAPMHVQKLGVKLMM